MATPIVPIATDDFWCNYEKVDLFLARKLRSGSTSLVLGAGASMGFGLPNWQSLVDALWLDVGASPPSPRRKPEEESDELLFNHFSNDRKNFAVAVQKALYASAKMDHSFLLRSELLQAISAFIANSLRGRAGAVITFNFDTVLEKYLRLLGLIVNSEISVPNLHRNADMTVYHPHGLLPFEDGEPTNIVFTSNDYDHVIGREADPWNKVMSYILGSSFPVFIGLSGADQRLRSLLGSIKDGHPTIARSNALYWGVRPTPRGEDPYITARWRQMGIAPRFIDDHKGIPVWLLSICQLAATQA